MQRVSLQGDWYDATGNCEGAGGQGHDASPDCQVNWCNAVIDMAYRRGDNDRPEVLGHGFTEATTWGEGMSGDHNMHQKPRSYLDDFECPRCGHCCPQQTEQEPLCWTVADGWVYADDISQDHVDETVKCKHEWVGLTDEEVNELVARFKRYTYVLLREVEAKLKEKNA